MTCNPPLVDPDIVLAGDTFAVMHINVAEDGSRHYDYLMETYNNYFDAERTCAALNAVDHDSYQVVTINHNVKVIHVWDGAEDEDGMTLSDILDGSPDSDAFRALRYAYELLNEGELEPREILARLRGYCEHANLVEFA